MLSSPSPVFIPNPAGTTASYGYFDVIDDGHVLSPDSYEVVEAYEYRDGRWVSSEDGGRLIPNVLYFDWDTGRGTPRAVRFESYGGRWRLRNLGNAPRGKYAFTFRIDEGLVVVYMGLGISEW